MFGQETKYFAVSLVSHFAILLVLVLGFAFSQPLNVFENTNKNDVISAVVLGEAEKSKILTPKSLPPPPQPAPEKPKPVAQVKQKPVLIKNKVVALKPAPKPKTLPKPKFLAQDLLADLQKQNQAQKLKQKKLQSHFQETLRLQAEESLRQQMLNEQLKLEAAERREAQGRINKYVALIIQSMTQHWIIPPQARQNLNGELMIRLAPGGLVLDVQVTRTSGDTALDSSARAAVFKASPLPVPSDPKEFEPFRQFVIKFAPKDVLRTSA